MYTLSKRASIRAAWAEMLQASPCVHLHVIWLIWVYLCRVGIAVRKFTR